MNEKNTKYEKELVQCNWFSKCENYEDIQFEFNYKIAKNKKEAVKSFNSLSWENAYWDKEGNFTDFLFSNFNDAYKRWNDFSRDVQNQVNYQEIVNKAEKTLIEAKITTEESYLISNYIHTMFMLDVYSECNYHDEFWDNILEIFKAGYLPCGMSRKGIVIY